jgi:AcrR family transcriptional regulator
LRTHNYRQATTNRIAERAGVSVGTLYQYFTNKDEIFDALIEREADRYLAGLECNLPRPGIPHRQAIRTLMEAGYAHHDVIQSLRAVMRHIPSGRSARHSRYLRDGLHQLIIRFLESLGPLPGLDDLSLSADVIIGLSEGLTYLGRVQRSPEELVDIMTEAVSRYLLVGNS